MNTELFKILPNEILFKILQERKKIKQAERFKKNFNKVIEVIKQFGLVMNVYLKENTYKNIKSNIKMLEGGLKYIEEYEENNSL